MSPLLLALIIGFVVIMCGIGICALPRRRAVSLDQREPILEPIDANLAVFSAAHDEPAPKAHPLKTKRVRKAPAKRKT